MDTPHKTAQGTPTPPGSVSGVARGGLGTAANLEDTQVLLTSDLQAAAKDVERTPAQEVAEPPVAPQARPSPRPAPVLVAPTPPVAAAAADIKAAPARRAPTVEPVLARRPSAARPGRGLAGVLAAAFLVLAGVAFVVSRGDGTIEAGGSDPAASSPAVTAPVATDRPKDDDDDGDGKGKGNGKGKGRGNGGDNKPD